MRGVYGFILPSVLAVMVVALLVGALALTLVSGNLRNTQASIVTSRAHLAAEAGLEEAVAEVWHRLLQDVPRSQRAIQDYVRRVQQWMGDGTARSIEGTLPDGSRFRVGIQPLGEQRDSGNRLVAYRFWVRSEGRAPGEGVRVLEQTFVVGRRFFPFDYALLTNNLNCILCHANISSLDRFRGNPDPNNRQTWWRRAKVATLEHLEARADTDSVIHGTLYTRGRVTLRYGENNQAPTLYSTLEDGEEVIRSSRRRQLGTDSQAVDCSDPGNCPSRRPLYQNYPTSQSLGSEPWPDGELVDSFPLPIPDTNGNRRIDDEEWQSAVQGSRSGGSDEYPPGRIRARMAVFTEPPAALVWQVAASIREEETHTLADNPRKLVVIDAEAEPLEITGTIFINGDVILRGRVRGNGTLLVRGNIYVMGDLVYDCGQGTQTRVCDYGDSSRLPALSLVAGGNVVMGDYLSRFRLRDVNIPGPAFAGNLNNPFDVEAGFEGGFAQTYSGCVDFWRARGSTDRSDWVRQAVNSSARCTVPNLVAMEVGNFNRLELLKASQALARGETYVPRFYRFESDEGIFFYNGCNEHTRRYEGYVKLDGSAGVSLRCTKANHSFRGEINLSRDQVRDLLRRAVVVDVHPDWLSKPEMKALWIASVQGNPARPQGALRVDGLIYTPNAVFSLAPGNGSFSSDNGDVSKVQGKLDMRGGIVAADTGILAPRQFDLYHDSRLRPRVPYDQNLTLFRGVWKVSRR